MNGHKENIMARGGEKREFLRLFTRRYEIITTSMFLLKNNIKERVCDCNKEMSWRL